MRSQLFACLLAACIITDISAQTDPAAAPSPAPAEKSTSNPLTLNGCIQSDADTDQFTLSDPADTGKEGTVYRLTGPNVRRYAGRRVRIVGGLVPSANVAAQAGALDPTRSSMVNVEGTATAPAVTAPRLEFRVTSVKPLTGSCVPQ